MARSGRLSGLDHPPSDDVYLYSGHELGQYGKHLLGCVFPESVANCRIDLAIG